MTYALCVSLALLGGRCKPAYNPCYTPCPVVYSVPCYQPVIVCQEMAEPVSDVEEEAEAASIESEMAEILAATDRPESLTPEIGLEEFAEEVAFDSATPVGYGGGGGVALGYTPGLGSLGGGLNGLAFGNGQGRPGLGLGGGGGSGSGGADTQGRQNINIGDEAEQGLSQGLVVNVNSMLNNINNLTQSQQQQQQQKQNQNQNQNNNNNCCNNGGGEEVPLPATAWMGLVGLAAAVVAKRRRLIG